MNIVVGSGNNRKVFEGVAGSTVKAATAHERKAYHGHLCGLLNISPNFDQKNRQRRRNHARAA